MAAILEFIADYLPEIISTAVAVSAVAIIGTGTFKVTQAINSSGQAIQNAVNIFVQILPFLVIALIAPSIIKAISSITNVFSGGGSR